MNEMSELKRMDDKDLIMKVDEAAKLLNMNPRTVREAIDSGSFPFGVSCVTKAGKKVYKVSRRKLYEFLGINNAS